MTSPTLSSDDKLLAALSYWGSFALWLLPALVIYLMKKDESVFIKKHSLQAILLNVAAFVVLGVAMSIVGTILGAITFSIGSLLMMLVQVVGALGVMIYMVILGLKTFQGEDPDVPVLTELIQKNLGA